MAKSIKLLKDKFLKKVTGGVGPDIPSGPSPSVTPANPAIVSRAEAEIGKPFMWGAAGPECYDASGLVSYCISGMHQHLFTCDQMMNWTRVSNPSPGDICVSANHCGIYVGSGTMVHIQTFGTLVTNGQVHSDMIFVRP